ncbi:MAG: HD domain-containing protein [Thermoplasmata archaeon]|jgi:3'-5' exoribonuclease|nr:HD domain-containing protein [Thermoplasmata archaeon]
MCGRGPSDVPPELIAGTAIEHTAVLQLRERASGPSFIKRIYLPTPITRRSGQQEMNAQTRIANPKQMIRALKSGDRVESYFSVTYKKPVTDYKYGSMFEFRVADRSGQATVKYWGGDDRQVVQKVHDSFGKGDVVGLRAEAVDYRGAIEISVSQKNGGTVTPMAEGQYDLSELVDRMEDTEAAEKRLFEIMDRVEEPHMRRLLDEFFKDPDFRDAFVRCPASIQLHSAAFGGLLHHTVNVAEMCLKVIQLHPRLDSDLVITGALLHDIGKVRNFEVTTSINATTEGNLIGHILLGDEELTSRIRRIEGFPEDVAQKLRHILLAHHGKREWGSPVEPMMPEALAVHEADDLDAKLDYMVAKRRDAVTEDDWVWDHRLGRLIYLR